MISKPMLITDLVVDHGAVIENAWQVADGTGKGASIIPAGSQQVSGMPNTPIEALDASVNLCIDGSSSSATIRLAEGTNVDGRAFIEMFTIQGSAGVFRTRSPKVGYGAASTTLQLEHAINEIGDVIIDAKIQDEFTLEGALKKIFSYYTPKSGLWRLGQVQLPATGNGYEAFDRSGMNLITTPGDSSVTTAVVADKDCILDVDYDNCLDAIRGVLEQYPCMMMSFDFSSRPWTMNIVNRQGIVSAEGRLSRNVKSAVVTRDDSELCTRAWIEGYKKKGEYGAYENKAASAKYGLIERVISGANDTPKAAKQTAKTYVQNHHEPRITVTIDGIDLSRITGETMDKFTIGKLMRLALPDYGETVTETITAISFSSVYRNQNAVSVTLNQEEDKVIKYIKKAQESARRAGRSAARVASAAITGAKVINANTLQLTWGNGETLNFSKAVTLKGEWGNGTRTVRAYQKNTVNGREQEIQVGLDSSSLNGIVLQSGKSPSVSGTWNLDIPLKVTYYLNNATLDTGFKKTITVSAQSVYNKGWGDGWDTSANLVELPPVIESGTASTFTLKYPIKENNQRRQTQYGFQLYATTPSATGYAVVSHGVQVHGRISIGNYYTAGWDNAAQLVELPEVIESGTASTFTLKYPIKEGSERKQTQYGFQLYATTPSSTGYAVVSHGVQIHGRISIGNYYTTGWNDGWDNAAGLVDPPPTIPSGDTASTFSFKYPEKSGTDRRQTQYGFQLYTSSSTPSATGYAVVSHGTQVHGRISIGNWYTKGREAATVTLSHGSVTTDSQYQKYVTYTASNYYNTSNKAEKKLYLVKSGSKSQLREGSASGTLVMEINNT